MLNMAMLFILVVSIVILCWRIVNWVWIKPKRIEKMLRAQGLKGNSYKFLFGDTKEMAVMIKEAKAKPIKLSHDIVPRVLPLHHHIISKYGKASFIWIGPVARIMIMEPQLIKQILMNNHIFKKPIPNPLAQFMVSGLSAYEDHKWAKHRKIINPAFYLEKLKVMVPAMQRSCSEMMEKWEKMGLMKDGKRWIEIDMQPCFENLTNQVISRTAFGVEFEDGNKIFHLQREQAELTRQVLQSVYIPGWRHIPTKRNRRLKEINNNICKHIRDIIMKREMGIKNGEHRDDDLLGMLLKSNEKEMKENAGMSMDEVIEECKTFYFSGQESTSNLLCWTMLMLSLHKTWQTRARDELFQVFGDNEPDFNGLNRLKNITMIVNEVLRLYPPATIFNRIIHKETKVGEMSLPAGVHLLLPIILVHHDKQVWGEDAADFRPDRFSEGVGKASINNDLCFFPFSWGPRICIGNNFALLETKLALAMILRRFSFDLSPSYTHAPSYVLTLQPQHGLHLILTSL